MSLFHPKKRFKLVQGFSLIELVLVISLLGILVAVVTPIIGRPFTMFKDQQTRSSLIDRAQSAFSHIAREARRAVPNSVRVKTIGANGSALELMPISFAGRYPYGDTPSDDLTLTPNQLDNNFSLLSDIPSSLTGERLIVNPVNTTLLYNAAASAVPVGIMTPTSTSLAFTDNGNQDKMTLSSAFKFDTLGIGSPTRRIFATQGPISYVCAPPNLTYYRGYAASVAQPSAPAATNQSLVTNSIESCQFSYANGVAQRNGLLTLVLTLIENGERVRLVEQIHVENTP